MPHVIVSIESVGPCRDRRIGPVSRVPIEERSNRSRDVLLLDRRLDRHADPTELTGGRGVRHDTVPELNEPEALGDAGSGELMARVRCHPHDADPVHQEL